MAFGSPFEQSGGNYCSPKDKEDVMRARLFAIPTALTLFAALGVPVRLIAQDATESSKKTQHLHYKLIDMGTLGGPQSYLNDGNGGNNAVNVLNNHGTLASWAD